jgi:hypothetical protein
MYSDHSISARIERHLQALRQDPGFARAQQQLNEAAGEDALLSATEYRAAFGELPPNVQARFQTIEQELKHDYARAQRVPGGAFVVRQLMGREVAQTSDALVQAGLPRIDTRFVRGIIEGWDL